MFNLIPVVMLLLVQGVGGDGLSLRQQQALLDLAHRAHAVQGQVELEDALASEAGVTGADLAFWVQVFSSVGVVGPCPGPEAAPLAQAPVSVAAPNGRTCPGWSASVRPRDGPSAF